MTCIMYCNRPKLILLTKVMQNFSVYHDDSETNGRTTAVKRHQSSLILCLSSLDKREQKLMLITNLISGDNL